MKRITRSCFYRPSTLLCVVGRCGDVLVRRHRRSERGVAVETAAAETSVLGSAVGVDQVSALASASIARTLVHAAAAKTATLVDVVIATL